MKPSWVFAPVLGCLLYWVLPFPSANHAVGISVLPVQTLHWQPHKPFAQALIDQLTPAVVRNSVVSRWKALKFWGSTYFAEKSSRVGRLRGVKVSGSRIFQYFDDDKPLGPTAFEAAKQSDVFGYNLTDMSLDDLFGRLQQQSQTNHSATALYFSDGISVLREISQDILPHIFLAGRGGIESCDVNVWMGSKGTIAFPHYDTFDNFFVQIRGSKRFWLVPPQQWVNTPGTSFNSTFLPLYSHLHTLHRQLVYDLPGVNGTKQIAQSNTEGLQVYTAQLSPGDLLFVPAYWLHRVEADSLSISVNSWCPSSEFGLMQQAVTRPLPFEQEWNLVAKAAAVKLFVNHLLVRNSDRYIFESEFSRQTVAALLEQRFYGGTGEQATDCVCSRADLMEQLPNPTQTAPRIRAAAISSAKFFATDIQRVRRSAVQVVGLHDFIEDLAAWAVGAGSVASFLRTCFL